MRRRTRKLFAIAAAFASTFAACGGTVASPSDAGPAAASTGGVVDAGAAEGAGGSSPPADGAPDGSDPLAPCTGDRDVFDYVVGAPGPFEAGEHRWTNLDAQWWTYVEPDVEVDVRVTGGGGTLRIYVPGTQLPAPGTYTQALQAMPTSPTLQPVFAHEGCAVTSGTLTIVELTTAVDDAGEERLASLVLWFDIQCRFDPAPVPVRGCMRYQASP